MKWLKNLCAKVGYKGGDLEFRKPTEPTTADLDVVAKAVLLKENINPSKGNVAVVASLFKLGMLQGEDFFDAMPRAQNLALGLLHVQSENILKPVAEALRQLPQAYVVPDFGGTKYLTIFDKIKNISDEEVQELWSRLIAGEIASGGTFSLRTIDVLSKMVSHDLKAFEEIMAPYISGVGLLSADYRSHTALYDDSSNNLDKVLEMHHLFGIEGGTSITFTSFIDFKSSVQFRKCYRDRFLELEFCHGVMKIEVDEDLNKINTVFGELVVDNSLSELVTLVRVQNVDFGNKFSKFVKVLDANGIKHEYVAKVLTAAGRGL